MDASASSLALSVVTPQRQVLSVQAQWVDIPAASGQMRALPQHAPTLGVLGAGVIRYQAEAGAEQEVKVSGGFFEVLADKVTVLADSTEA